MTFIIQLSLILKTLAKKKSRKVQINVCFNLFFFFVSSFVYIISFGMLNIYCIIFLLVNRISEMLCDFSHETLKA